MIDLDVYDNRDYHYSHKHVLTGQDVLDNVLWSQLSRCPLKYPASTSSWLPGKITISRSILRRTTLHF